MGTCRYCGESAGLFRKSHSDCASRHDQALQDIAGHVNAGLRSSSDFAPLVSRIETLARASHVSFDERQGACLQAWESAVAAFLNDDVLDASEEERLTSFGKQFNLQRGELDRHGCLTKLVKAGALREVIEGKLPERLSIDGELPVNLQKGERIVWAFRDCKLLEDKTRRQYVGGSWGLNVRIVKGVYLRTSDFSSRPIEYSFRALTDTGWVVLTNKNFYFAGPVKSLRIPYAKVVSFEPYSDGVGVMRDGANAKPQVFVTGDGWFTYNLVKNLARLDASGG